MDVSQPGEGAEFLLTFPKAGPSEASASVVKEGVRMKPRILVVEDENARSSLALSGPAHARGLRGRARRGSGEIALAAPVEPTVFDLVLTDLALGRRAASGMDVLQGAKEIRPETTQSVMITAHGSEKIAVEAMKAGAEDYVPKPFDNDEIASVVSARWNARASSAKIVCCASRSSGSTASRT